MHLVVLAALWGCASAGWGRVSEADADHDGLLDAEEAGFGTTVGDPDTDDDGLFDGAELDVGTHPLVPDDDFDGLTDGQEVSEIGTDPWLPDTDGDGYRDFDEVGNGSDPLDDEDWIYTGGWPYQPDKDAFGGPALADAENAPGEPFARLKLVDQHGEQVDLYDFAGQGKPVLVMFDGAWCGPSADLAAWMAGGEDARGYEEAWGHVRELVDAGDLYWLHVLFQDAAGGTVDPEEVAAWDRDHPHPLVPTLAGDDEIAGVYLDSGVVPAVFFLDAHMRIVAGFDGTYAGMDAANAYAP